MMIAQGSHKSVRPLLRGAKAMLGLTFVVCTNGVHGCILADCINFLFVRGKLIDAETLEGISGAAIGGRAFTGGVETDFVSAIIFDGSPNGPLSSENGAFQAEFSTGLGPCPAPEFPRPDRVEIIVVRDGCEQSFFIDINANTVVDPTAPDDVIELKDPILVPPCVP
jgi:hypothetical protein